MIVDTLLAHIFRRVLPGELLWKVKTPDKEVYLTFDDGPIPEMTPDILDILDSYDAKATFFCVGENVRKYPSLFREIKKKGHAAGNHTNYHLKGIRNTFEDYLTDIRQAANLIDSRLFRPPYGLMTYRQAKALSDEFKIVMWTVLTRDFDPAVSPEQCLKTAVNGVRPGSIIVFHDNLKAREKVLYALPGLLEFLKAEGYRTEILC